MRDYTPTETSAYIAIAALMAVCLYGIVYFCIHLPTIIALFGEAA